MATISKICIKFQEDKQFIEECLTQNFEILRYLPILYYRSFDKRRILEYIKKWKELMELFP